jgi:hypothetical protein
MPLLFSRVCRVSIPQFASFHVTVCDLLVVPCHFFWFVSVEGTAIAICSLVFVFNCVRNLMVLFWFGLACGFRVNLE